MEREKHRSSSLSFWEQWRETIAGVGLSADGSGLAGSGKKGEEGFEVKRSQMGLVVAYRVEDPSEECRVAGDSEAAGRLEAVLLLRPLQQRREDREVEEPRRNREPAPIGPDVHRYRSAAAAADGGPEAEAEHPPLPHHLLHPNDPPEFV